MVVKPIFFVDPSSVTCESLDGILKVHVPDEDEYEPENQKVDTIIININQDDAKNSSCCVTMSFRISRKYFIISNINQDDDKKSNYLDHI